jgi:hypothetical protein
MDIVLSDDQKDKIRSYFGGGEKPELKQITQDIFGDPTLTGKTKEGRAVKQFCKDEGLDFSVQTIVLKGLLELTDEQKKIIESNYRHIVPLKLTRQVFGDDSLLNFSQEFRTLEAYIEELGKRSSPTGEIIEIGYGRDDLAEKDYAAPRTLKQVIEKVNKYLLFNYEESNLKKQQLFELNQLKQYLSIFRFIFQINTYKKSAHRNLFEDAFIRYTHDKPDLTQEDLDQYITLCDQVVRIADIVQRIEQFRLLESTEGVSIKLTETIGSLETERNACEKIKDTLYNNLTTKRNKRLEEKNDGNERIINLVQLWRDEDFRVKYLALADLEKTRVEDEVVRIGNMSELKALLKGATLEELARG